MILKKLKDAVINRWLFILVLFTGQQKYYAELTQRWRQQDAKATHRIKELEDQINDTTRSN